MPRAAFMIATTLALAACNDGAGGSDRREEEPEFELPPPDFALGGQTGSGRWSCQGDAECERIADEMRDWFTQPRPAMELLRSECLTWGPEECGDAGECRDDVCECTFRCSEGCDVDPRVRPWGRQVGDVGEPDGTVDVWLFDRLPPLRDHAGVEYMRGVEFDGCDPARPRTCEQLCERFETGWNAAAARTYDVTVQSTSCAQLGYACTNVFRAEGQCYLNLGSNFGSTASQRGPFECSECAESPEEARERVSCRQPVCGGEPGDLDIEVEDDAGVDCAER